MTKALPTKRYPPKEVLKELMEKIDTEKPSKEAVSELRRMLREYPEFWRRSGDMVDLAVRAVVDMFGGSVLMKESMKHGAKVIRRNLGYEEAPEIERLLIEQVALCWLQLNMLEVRYACGTSAKGSISIASGDYWERTLSAQQRRFLRACETLARIRKLTRRTPPLQVNIATAGGQQVNVSGEVRPRG